MNASDSERRSSPTATTTEHSELAVFESEYTIERLSQRDLILDLGAVLWFLTFVIAIVAGTLDPTPSTTAGVVARTVVATISALMTVLYLTYFRQLDDVRTRQVQFGLAILSLACMFALGFIGPGALGGMFIFQIAIAVYAAQFLQLPQLITTMVFVTIFAALSVHFNLDKSYGQNLIYQTVMLVIIDWSLAISIYALNKDRVAALTEAERVAFSDPLTGLPNTRMLRRRSAAMLDSRNERINRAIGLVLLDLDGFRSANILRGHRDGDRLLTAVADAMRDGAREKHLVTRTGSDEFAVLILDADRETLEREATRYRDLALHAIDNEEAGSAIDASVGVALSGDDGDTLEELLRAADRSVYLVKASHERITADRPVRPITESLPAPREAPQRPRPQTSWVEQLRWTNRPAQSRFAAASWLVASLGMAIAIAMPDAIVDNWTAITILLTAGVAVAVIRYIVPPSDNVFAQLFDVLISTTILALAIYFTGNSDSAAWPIGLLILTYIGWFLPLRLVVPASFVMVLVVLTPLAFERTQAISIMDAVTIFGGVGFSISLLLILYYNHYYLERAQTLTQQLSTIDPRAGTNNRRAFESRMREELEVLSYGDLEALAVVMIDLGNFKSVSANYGRTIGDRLLSIVAYALEEASRDGDCVARLGGDEFAVVAPGVDAESARALAQRLVKAVTEALRESDLPSNQEVRASAGFALYGMHGRTTDELVTAADIALTAAKTSSRDSSRVSSFVVAL